MCDSQAFLGNNQLLLVAGDTLQQLAEHGVQTPGARGASTNASEPSDHEIDELSSPVIIVASSSHDFLVLDL